MRLTLLCSEGRRHSSLLLQHLQFTRNSSLSLTGSFTISVRIDSYRRFRFKKLLLHLLIIKHIRYRANYHYEAQNDSCKIGPRYDEHSVYVPACVNVCVCVCVCIYIYIYIKRFRSYLTENMYVRPL